MNEPTDPPPNIRRASIIAWAVAIVTLIVVVVVIR